MKPKAKPAATDAELRMPAAEFDQVMRQAFGAAHAPPPPTKPARKRKPKAQSK